MRCKNCGTENKEGALYCGKCGQPLTNNSKKKKKGLAIALSVIGVCVIVLGVVLFLLITKINQKNNYNEKMSLGDKYFQQMKYEDAILAYEDAINIDKKQANAYISLSQVYVAQNDYEKAYEILEEAPVEEMKENQKQIIEDNSTIIEEQIIQNNLDGDYKEQMDLGNENFQQKQYEQAILAYEAAIVIDDKKAEGYVALSEVYVAQQDYEKAYEVLESAPLDVMEEEEKTKITEQIGKVQEAEQKAQESVFYKASLFQEENGQLYSSIILGDDIFDLKKVSAGGSERGRFIIYDGSIYKTQLVSYDPRFQWYITSTDLNDENQNIISKNEVSYLDLFCIYENKLYYSANKTTYVINLENNQEEVLSNRALEFLDMNQNRWIYEDINTKECFYSEPGLKNEQKYSWIPSKKVFVENNKTYYTDDVGVLHIVDCDSVAEIESINLYDIAINYSDYFIKDGYLYMVSKGDEIVINRIDLEHLDRVEEKKMSSDLLGRWEIRFTDIIGKNIFVFNIVSTTIQYNFDTEEVRELGFSFGHE